MEPSSVRYLTQASESSTRRYAALLEFKWRPFFSLCETPLDLKVRFSAFNIFEKCNSKWSFSTRLKARANIFRSSPAFLQLYNTYLYTPDILLICVSWKSWSRSSLCTAKGLKRFWLSSCSTCFGDAWVYQCFVASLARYSMLHWKDFCRCWVAKLYAKSVDANETSHPSPFLEPERCKINHVQCICFQCISGLEHCLGCFKDVVISIKRSQLIHCKMWRCA